MPFVFRGMKFHRVSCWTFSTDGLVTLLEGVSGGAESSFAAVVFFFFFFW